MKRIFLGMVVIAFLAAPALAINGGKKAKKSKAKKECSTQKCDPTKGDPKCCEFKSSTKDAKCNPATTCKGS